MANDLKIIATLDAEQLQAELQKSMESLERLTNTIVEQGKEIQRLEKEYEEVGKIGAQAFMKGNDDLYRASKDKQQTIQAEISALKEERAEAVALAQDKEKYVNALEAEIEKSKESGEAHQSLKARLRNLREEIAELALAGQRGSEEYIKLAQSAAEISKASRKAQNDIAGLADELGGLDAVSQSMGLAADGFEVYTGVVGQFAGSTEKAEEMQTKLMSTIAIANGINEIAQKLEKKSQLMRSISILQLKAQVAAQRLATKETIAATIAQKALNLVASANPYVLLAVAITSVVGAIVAMTLAADNAVDKMEALNEQEKLHAERLNDIANAKNIDFDESINAAKQELELAKARNASVKEQRELEDEVLRLQSAKANYNVGFYGVDDIDQKRKEIEDYKKVLQQLQDTSKKKIKIDLDLDGKVDKVKVEDAIKQVQERIDLLGKEVELKMTIKTDAEQAKHEQDVLIAERKEQDKKDAEQRAKDAQARAANERQILRKEEDNRIALEKDAAARENAQIKAKYDRAIEDLKVRLETEKNLTAKAKESIRRQIAQQEELRTQEETQAARKRAKAIKAIEDEIQANDIALMDEGLSQRLEQNLKAYNDKMAKLKERRESGEINTYQYAILQAQTLAEYEKTNKETLKNALADFQTYEQEKLEIERRYQRIINDFYTTAEDGTRTLRAGVTEENVAEVVKAMKKELADLDTKKLQESSDYIKFFSANLVMSKDALRKVGNEIKNSLNDQLKAGTITIEQYAKAWDEVDAKIQEAENKSSEFNTLMREGIQGLAQARKEMADQEISAAQIDLNNAREEYKKAKAQGDEEAEKTAMSKMIAAARQLATAKENKEAANELSQTAKTLADVSFYLSGITATMQTALASFTDVADSFGIKTDSAAFDYANVAVDTLSNAAGAFASFMSDDIFGAVQKTIQTIAGLITGLNKANDQQLQRSIEKHMKNVGKLQDQYNSLGKAISAAYSSTKAELIRREQELLRKQNEELARAREEEERKKKTDKNVVEDLTRQIRENEEKIEDLKAQEIDAIFGQDIQSAISDLANALVDAWSNGEDAVKAWADVSKDWVKQALNEMLKDYIQKQQYAERIRAKINEAMDDDHIIDPTEWREILDYSNQLAENAKANTGWMQDLFQELESTTRNSQAKGIAQASQESVNELNGRATAIQGHTYLIAECTQLLVETTNDILAAVMHIDTNTDTMSRQLSTMGEDMAYVRRGMSDIQTNGIRLR